jgi:hypothetical protein
VSARTYDMHGVRISVASEDDQVGGAIDARLRHFRSPGHGPVDVAFELQTTEGPGSHTVSRPPGPARHVYDPPAGEVLYFDEHDALYIDYEGRVRVLASVPDGRVVISIAESERDNVWLLSRPLLTLPLVELLKARGLYSVHAAGAALDGGAIVLPGASGSGKSTLAVALARAGLEFLADDMVFLARGDDGLRVCAFPDEVDVSDSTAEWFPELAGLVGRTPAGWPKHRVRLEAAFGARVAAPCRPGVLVFPVVTAGERSSLEPMPPDEALVELAPNVLLTNRAASQAHLDTLGELVRASRCYRLHAARDFERIGELLREIASEGIRPSTRS